MNSITESGGVSKPPKERQRATYSCDRCKQRKRACKRYDNKGNRVFDTKTECQICKSAGAVCQTTIARKKRTYFSVSESSIIQLKCLTKIVKAMFPERDPNNFNDIQSIAQALYVSLPNENGESAESGHGSSVDTNSLSNTDTDSNTLSANGKQINKGDNKLPDEPNVNETGVNEIGLGGTERLFTALLEVEQMRSHKKAPFLDNNNSLNSVLHQRKLSTFTPSYIINGNDISRLLLLNRIPINECRLYADTFFSRINESFYVFNKEQFCIRQEELFNLLNALGDLGSEVKIEDIFCKEEICTIYFVWIIGRRSLFLKHQLAKIPVPKNLVSDDVITDYLSSINLCLSGVFFTNNLHSVRMLFLASLFHSVIKNRNTAWHFMANCCIKCFGLGFHTNSTVDKIEDEVERENIRIVFWSAFENHMNNCAVLGRLPNITLYEADLDLPKLNDVDDPKFKGYYFSSIKLLKIMYEILENRKYLIKSKNPWSQLNYVSVLKIRNDLITWINDLSADLKNYKSENPKRYLIKLHLQYHYCVTSLTVPYLIAYAFNPDKTLKLKNESVDTLCMGVKSAVNSINVIMFSGEHNYLNGILYYDLFYAYNSLMILLLCHTLIKSKEEHNLLADTLKNKFQIDMPIIVQTIQNIKDVNERFGSIATGVMQEASRNIVLLLKYFMIEELNGQLQSNEKRHQSQNQSQRQQFQQQQLHQQQKYQHPQYKDDNMLLQQQQQYQQSQYKNLTNSIMPQQQFQDSSPLQQLQHQLSNPNIDPSKPIVDPVHELDIIPDNSPANTNSNQNDPLADTDFFGILDFMNTETRPQMVGMNDRIFWDWNKLFPTLPDNNRFG